MARRDLARGRLERLSDAALPIVQAALAAAAAWLIAGEGLGHSGPFFAPIAALITLGATRGQRVRQATELMVASRSGWASATC